MRDVPLLLAIDSLETQDHALLAAADGTGTTQALATGSAEIGSLNDQTMWTAISKGAKVKTIMQRYVTAALVVTPTAVANCAALNGKGFGYSTNGGTTPALLKLYFDQHCPGTKLQTVLIPGNAGRITGLQSGQLSAAVLEVEDVLQLEKDAPGKFLY